MMNRSLATISRRYLLQHPLQTGLTLLGIMLGVAIVVAIDLANFSAKRAFALSMEMTSGSATPYIKGGSGGTEGRPTREYISAKTPDIGAGARSGKP